MTFLQRQVNRDGPISATAFPQLNGHVIPASTPPTLRNGGSPPNKASSYMLPNPSTRSPGPSPGRPLPTRGSSGNLGAQSSWSSCSSLSDKWRFGLLLWTAAALWWFGMRAIESRWDSGSAGSPFEDVALLPTSAELYKGRSLMDAASKAGVPLHQPGDPLGVCIMTADFWGSPTAGGTATAYHLLAQVLASDSSLRVTFLGVTKKLSDCENGIKLNIAAKHNINFTCLDDSHFVPEVVETEPYEQLSHAIVSWVKENINKCDVIHGHEWGGLFVDLATLDNYRQLKPGLRFAIEAHGGHFWSTQGQVQRPLDVMSLRIDHGERMTLGLASALISPTHYMTAFLKQRGWRLPPENIVIPNVVPAVEAASHVGETKQVWRLAFFSRLEERKGLKLFVEAVNKLAAGDFNFDHRFEIFFVGAEARIDMRGSEEWIKEKTIQWKFPVHIKVNVKRDEALDILSKEGVLLVLCSLIDNMPYVVAEAAVKGIPFIVFDVGGVLEMFDQEQHQEAIILEPSADALYARLLSTMNSGSLKTVELSNRVTTGKEQWLDWHANFASTRIRKLQQEDFSLAAKAAGKEVGKLQTTQIAKGMNALTLWNSLCLPRDHTDAALLLIPEEYQLINPQTAQGTLVELLQMGMLTDNGIGALTFGASVPGGKVAYPNGPTWMLYSGDEGICNDDVPVLIRKQTFCEAYLAEARVFRTYHSWILSMLLGQAGWRMHTYPEVMFQAVNFTTEGHICMPDKPPTDRHLTFNSASNLYADAEEVMVNLHLAPFPKPTSSIVEDFPTEQNHKGWQIGFFVANSPTLRPLSFWLPQSGVTRDGRWGCSPEEASYPALQNSLMHPCAGGGTSCCGFPSAPIITRFNSFFASEHAVLIMAYEVWPICGDGLDLEIALTSRGDHGPFRHIFMRQGFEADQHEVPQRQRVEFRFQLHVGDNLDFIVWPRGTHDCDGTYIVDMQMWQDDGMHQHPTGKGTPKEEQEQQPTLKKASVGEITEGDGAAYKAAARGEGVVAQQAANRGTGALEGAKAQQGETDGQTTHSQGRALEAAEGWENLQTKGAAGKWHSGRRMTEQGRSKQIPDDLQHPLGFQIPAQQEESPLQEYSITIEALRGLGYLQGSQPQERHVNWLRSLGL